MNALMAGCSLAPVFYFDHDQDLDMRDQPRCLGALAVARWISPPTAISNLSPP